MQYTKSTRQGKNIFVVDMKAQSDKILSEISHHGIAKYDKIWIIINKKWYSWWVVCNDCWHIPKCQNCDISVTYYQNDRKGFFGVCNICKTIYPEFVNCQSCKSKNIKSYGLWIQKLSEYIYQKYQIQTLEISRDSTISQIKIDKIKKNLLDNHKKIILWTTILTTPIRDFELDMIIFQNADIWQNLPNYDSNHNSFMSIYHAIANHNCKNFVIQTSNPNSDVSKYIQNMDLEEFLKNDNEKRKIYMYPPHGEVVSLLYKHEMEKRLFGSVNKLYQEIIYMKNKYIIWLTNPEDIQDIQKMEIFATPPMIYKIYNKYRYNIVIKWPKVRNFLEYIYHDLNIWERGFKVDRGWCWV